MYKVDLHTHSIASPDGGLTADDYENMFKDGELDAIAVTDHETIKFAVDLHNQLGDKIIVGEEIKTTEGEIIGLFLKERISPGLSPKATIQEIRQQNGLVYIPHPFETVRSGMQLSALDRISSDVDIVEIFNGRAYFQNKSAMSRDWAKAHKVAGAASSDAHGRLGWGRTFTTVQQLPNKDTLVRILADGKYSCRRLGLRGILYPKLNRLKKKFGR